MSALTWIKSGRVYSIIFLTGVLGGCTSPQNSTQFRSLANADIHLTHFKGEVERTKVARAFQTFTSQHRFDRAFENHFSRSPASQPLRVAPTPYDVGLASDYSACDMDTICTQYKLGAMTGGGYVEFNVDAPAPGAYKITIHYLSSEDSVVELDVNGDKQTSVPLSPSADPYVHQASAVGNVTFPLGKSVLKFTMSGDSFLNISGFTISPDFTSKS